MRSSRGLCRRSATTPSTYVAYSVPTRTEISSISGVNVLVVRSSRSSLQRSSLSRSSGSTPSMSPIMAMGSGAATSRTNSQLPRVATFSISSTQISRTFACWSDTRFGVKP